MNIKKRMVGNCIVLQCSGKITLGPETAAVRNAVYEALEGGAKKIVMDLGDVSYIDSSGIGELVRCFTHSQSKECNLVLLNLTKRIQELLVITKLIAVFDVYENESSALAGC